MNRDHRLILSSVDNSRRSLAGYRSVGNALNHGRRALTQGETREALGSGADLAYPPSLSSTVRNRRASRLSRTISP
jgi:hypothetical protein